MGVFQSCNVPFCNKLTNTQGCVIRSVIVMERPCVGFPKAPSFVTHCLIRCQRMSLRHRSFRIPTQGQTVNQTVYKDILLSLMRQCVTRGRPFWEAHAWTLHHDNAPDHAVLSIGQFFERNIAILEYLHIPPIWPRVTFSSSPRSNLF